MIDLFEHNDSCKTMNLHIFKSDFQQGVNYISSPIHY